MRVGLGTIGIVLALLGAGCGGGTSGTDAGAVGDASPDTGADAGSDAGPPRDWPEMTPPSSTSPRAGVLRDVLTIDVPAPPENPVTHTPTPAELNRLQVLRFHAEAGGAPRAVVVAMPGFLGGAASLEGIATELVAGSIAMSAPVEVWAIDRRSNLLEDLRGLDTAEVTGNADVARGYYFGGETVGGHAFGGFVDQADVAYMSEWGLAMLVSDVHTLIGHVTAADRVGHVFLLGHSLGGTFAETYAAWRFEDGTRGAEELAGVILVDGSQSETPSDETMYRMGGGTGFMQSPGVNGVRSMTRYFALPLLGVATYPRAETLSIEAIHDPTAVVEDAGREQLLATLLGLTRATLPAMTNAAALGFGFDSASNGLSFAAVSCGTSAGGPLAPYTSVLGPMLQHPSDPSVTYTWVDAYDAMPAEVTPIAALAHAWVDGRTNFAEWYFPARLPIDLGAVGGLAVGETSWQAMEGLRAFDGALMDAPVLAIATELRTAADYEPSRMRGAPIGPGRRVPMGTPRTDPRAFDVLDASALTHIDPVLGPASPQNPVPSRVLSFVLDNVLDGTTSPTLP
jgi:pimeloyl-ACP methyl ester carboxylesterase